MLTSHPRDALVLAQERARRLREETAADDLRPASGTRRALATSLRRAANRLDPAPLARVEA
jgi:hypothetical protein